MQGWPSCCLGASQRKRQNKPNALCLSPHRIFTTTRFSLLASALHPSPLLLLCSPDLLAYPCFLHLSTFSLPRYDNDVLLQPRSFTTGRFLPRDRRFDQPRDQSPNEPLLGQRQTSPLRCSTHPQKHWGLALGLAQGHPPQRLELRHN